MLWSDLTNNIFQKTGTMDKAIIRKEGDVNQSEQREIWHNMQSSQVREYLKKDEKYFIGQALSSPCIDVINHSNGIYIQDLEGKRYMDFHGNNLHQIGYGNTYITEALKRILDELPFCPRRYTNIPAIELAAKLATLAPGQLNKVLFAPGGSEVNSIAIKLARIVSGKHKIISMWDSYHGAGLDTISVGGEQIFRYEIGPLMTGVEHVPPPNSYRGIWNDSPRGEMAYADYIEYIIEQEGDIGAVMAETIRNTDVQVPTKAYWKRVRQICDRNDVLLILDEIPICLGRTGKIFAFENYDIIPDIVTIGKGLGGGVIPMAAVITRDDFNIDPLKSVGHFTHEKSPLGAVAGLETLKFIEQEKLTDKVQQMEEYIRGRLMHLKECYEVIGDIRGIGMLWGIELVTNRKTKEKAIALAERVMYNCLQKGLSFKVSHGNVINLSPPLIITERELDRAVDIIAEAIGEEMQK